MKIRFELGTGTFFVDSVEIRMAVRLWDRIKQLYTKIASGSVDGTPETMRYNMTNEFPLEM
jgi:hypothetical protein